MNILIYLPLLNPETSQVSLKRKRKPHLIIYVDNYLEKGFDVIPSDFDL